jgi:hypothetical protein
MTPHAKRSRILIALLLACGAAQASEWVSIGKSDNGGDEFFADISSIGITGETRRAWIKTVFLPDKAHSLERMAFNCGEGTMRWEASTLYSVDGNVMGGEAAGTFPTPWKPVPPDTAGSAIMHFVCKWKPQ